MEGPLTPRLAAIVDYCCGQLPRPAEERNCFLSFFFFFSLFPESKLKPVLFFSSFCDSKINTLCHHQETLPLGISLRKSFHFCWIVSVSFQKASSIKSFCRKLAMCTWKSIWHRFTLPNDIQSLFFFDWWVLFLGYFKKVRKISLYDTARAHLSAHDHPQSIEATCGSDHSAMKQEHAYVLSHSDVDSVQQYNFQSGHGKGCSKTGCLMVVCSLTHSGCVCFSLGCLPSRCHFCRGCYSRPRGKFILQNTEFVKDTKNI